MRVRSLALFPSIAALAAILLAAAGCTYCRTRGSLCCATCAPDAAARAPDAAAPAPDPDAALLPPEVSAVLSPRAWRIIAIHHSAGAIGGAARFDQWHKAKGWDGVGYDFVIGNGSDTKDGEIETTFRWKEQRDGAHVKGWNDLAIGICLVGNFQETDPTPAQRESLERLVRHLRRRFAIPGQRVVGHGQLGDTECPGKRLSVRDVAARTDPNPPASPAPTAAADARPAPDPKAPSKP